MQEKPVSAIEDGGRSTLDLRGDVDRTLLPPFEAPASFHKSVDESRLLAIDWTQAPGWAIAYAVRYEHLEGRFVNQWVGSSTDGELAQTLPAPAFFPVDMSERGKLIFYSYDRSIATRVAVRQAACATVATETVTPMEDRTEEMASIAAADVPPDQLQGVPEHLVGKEATVIDMGAGQVEEWSVDPAKPHLGQGVNLPALGQVPEDPDEAMAVELRLAGYGSADVAEMVAAARKDREAFPLTLGEAGDGLTDEAQAQQERAGYFYRNHLTPQQQIDQALKLGEQRAMRTQGLSRAAIAVQQRHNRELERIAVEAARDAGGYRQGVVHGREEILAMVDPRNMTFTERLAMSKRILAGQPLLPDLARAPVEEAPDAG